MGSGCGAVGRAVASDTRGLLLSLVTFYSFFLYCCFVVISQDLFYSHSPTFSSLSFWRCNYFLLFSFSQTASFIFFIFIPTHPSFTLHVFASVPCNFSFLSGRSCATKHLMTYFYGVWWAREGYLLYLKMGHSRPLSLCFVFSLQFTMNKCFI